MREHHSTWLRGILKAERKRRSMSLQATATAIARKLGRDGLTKQGFQAWEEGVAEPNVSAFEAWAEVLGMQLEVALVPAGDDTVSVRVPRSAADACRSVALLADGDRGIIVAMMDRLKQQK